jgi:hypothetical protein
VRQRVALRLEVHFVAAELLGSCHPKDAGFRQGLEVFREDALRFLGAPSAFQEAWCEGGGAGNDGMGL